MALLWLRMQIDTRLAHACVLASCRPAVRAARPPEELSSATLSLLSVLTKINHRDLWKLQAHSSMKQS
jgi:hypothetical protein